MMHVAAVYDVSSPGSNRQARHEAEQRMVAAAVEGTRNVLQSVEACPSVRLVRGAWWGLPCACCAVPCCATAAYRMLWRQPA